MATRLSNLFEDQLKGKFESSSANVDRNSVAKIAQNNVHRPNGSRNESTPIQLCELSDSGEIVSSRASDDDNPTEEEQSDEGNEILFEYFLRVCCQIRIHIPFAVSHY